MTPSTNAKTLRRSQWLLLISWLTCSLAGRAQDAPTYQTPPKALADLVTAPLTPTVSLSDKGDMMLILEQAAAPGIDELAQPEFKLAGLRLNPANNGPSRARYITGLKLKKVLDKEEKALTGLAGGSAHQLRSMVARWVENCVCPFNRKPYRPVHSRCSNRSGSESRVRGAQRHPGCSLPVGIGQ